MLFWSFMLATSSLIPIAMMVVGAIFLKAAPKKINHVYGYRSQMSMKNRDTWEFAHQHCGRSYLRWGSAMLVPSVIPMLFCVGDTALSGILSAIICTVNLIPLIAVMVGTEKALKRTFDKNGNRIIGSTAL